MSNETVDVVVVGAGIVGTAVAVRLARDGHEVLTVDPKDYRFGSSICNAGHYVGSHLHPLAHPGMVRSGLESLARRDGAFAVNLRHLPTLLPWLCAFTRSCTRANVANGVNALAWLARSSALALDEVALDTDSLTISSNGLLEVFYTAKSFDAGRVRAREMNALGVNADELEPERALSASPRLREGLVGAVSYGGDRSLDPRRFRTALDETAKALGVRALEDEVLTLTPSDSHVVVRSRRRTITARFVVVAAGAWSATLVRDLGFRLRLCAAKGYSITLAGNSDGLASPMILSDPHLAINPLASGLRISSRFEITVPDDRVLRRAKVGAILPLARRYIDLGAEPRVRIEWTGNRPVPADGFPVIGPIRSAPRVIMCTGHGMIGTSTALGSARLVSDLIAKRPVPTEVAALSPRFRS